MRLDITKTSELNVQQTDTYALMYINTQIFSAKIINKINEPSRAATSYDMDSYNVEKYLTNFLWFIKTKFTLYSLCGEMYSVITVYGVSKHCVLHWCGLDICEVGRDFEYRYRATREFLQTYCRSSLAVYHSQIYAEISGMDIKYII